MMRKGGKTIAVVAACALPSILRDARVGRSRILSQKMERRARPQSPKDKDPSKETHLSRNGHASARRAFDRRETSSVDCARKTNAL